MATNDSPAESICAHKLHGSWRLEKFSQTIVATSEEINVFGDHPTGFINYGSDGRMLVLMVAEDRPCRRSTAEITENDRAQLFRTMVAYAGTYSLEGRTVRHRLEASWNQVFTGGEQVRNIEVQGDVFTMSTNPQPRSQDGQVAVSVITWRRCTRSD